MPSYDPQDDDVFADEPEPWREDDIEFPLESAEAIELAESAAAAALDAQSAF